MTKRHRSVSAKQRRWRADYRPLLHLDYEDRLRSDPRAAIAFKKFRSWGATDDDIEGPVGSEGAREGGMIDAFAAIPFVWYVNVQATLSDHAARARIARFLEGDRNAYLALCGAYDLKLADQLRTPNRRSRREPLERFAFRFVLNYLSEVMPLNTKLRRPMKETALVVSALLDRDLRPNKFQHDVVLKRLWSPGRYKRDKESEIDEK